MVRYLLAHELAHLTHMNHTPRFWELVAYYEPQWRELDRELLRGWKQVPAWVLVALRTRARPPGSECVSSRTPTAGEHVGSIDLRDEPVHWNLGDSQSYGEYLHLDLLLNAQRPLTAEHSEMLFIIVHQVSELWMRLLRHELAGVMECVRRDDLDPSFKMFNRIARIQAQLLAVWEVLSTMTPFDYSAFRNALGRSSGFQSQQYRLLEFVLGNKHAAMIEVHQQPAAGLRRIQARAGDAQPLR